MNRTRFLCYAVCVCCSSLMIAADEVDLASALLGDDGYYRIHPLVVDFEVFELTGKGPVKMSEQQQANAHRMFLFSRKPFDRVTIGRSSCSLRNDVEDVVDGQSFFHCPVLPKLSEVSEWDLTTKQKFLEKLGRPSSRGGEFKGFFEVIGHEVQFCYFQLDLKNKRIFAGISKRLAWTPRLTPIQK